MNAVVERPPPISVTDAAIERAKHLMNSAADSVIGLRIGVETKGCSGFAYKVDYASEPGKFEDVVERDGVRFYIDPMAIMYLLCTELDYVESKMESSFVFTNPNETGRCGCGESFSVSGQ